jgi:hypothetical protein
MALSYAGGPLEIEHGKPLSAFSKGDLLQFSDSSLSYADVLQAAGSVIAGVALSSSTESVSDKVPYIVAQPLTRFWITATINSAGSATRGYTSELSAHGSGDWQLGDINSSLTNNALVRSESSTDATIAQRDKESNKSWVIISIVSTTLGVGSGAVG